MDRLVFTANTAMSEYRLDRQNITHELANVATTGFKKAFQVANRAVRVEGDGFDSRFLPRASTSPQIDLSEGSRQFTGRSLDVAFDNATVLGVQSDNGELAWTRRGDLSIDPEGFLRTGEGYLVLDESAAPFQVPLDFNNYEISQEYLMNFNSRNNLFEAVIKLKQGFYNYKYIVVDSDNQIIQGEIDGNFDETENEYNVIVYYRNFGERYDRVIGVGKGLSQYITN